MKKFSYIVIIVFINQIALGQLSKSEIEQARQEHIHNLSDTSSGVLNLEEIASLGEVNYFPFDSTYQCSVTFTKSKGKKFEMPTSTDRKPVYRRFGYADFEIEGNKLRLEVYQNVQLSKQKEYKNYLFIPFKDKTSGNSTYGGGRYIDFEIPSTENPQIDFNTAYNPYCAYSYRYSCPIPPVVNTLDVKIRAGEKTPIGH